MIEGDLACVNGGPPTNRPATGQAGALAPVRTT